MLRFGADKNRAYAALMAVFCVLFLCWGQQSSWIAASCPQSQHHNQASITSAGDIDNTVVVAECDSSSQLLQQAHLNILDGGAAVSLFVGITLLIIIRHFFVGYAQAPPSYRRRRPHLLFCVFNE
ncbi:MAG: hypothetical protein B7X54_02150 [Idiomarina sp. 34-48-12]|nr:MAG: hypothetical protein B7X54_02150 [Idiomarina sp. 34-48-12]